ncbi:serine hydrolase domain-containing protein [Roseivirga thermotolerans]|uniref:Serine hydrolase n=1 Tax=Roseivirga thermotolerans TaxID=1758176 RepID=A0ABQ3I729_9BACT|nr:serine hydrolase domain-containing protein [Roseivirga thermotolerans]GHE63260.1 serine hydrolase [Roseivirga thermotolerans]
MRKLTIVIIALLCVTLGYAQSNFNVKELRNNLQKELDSLIAQHETPGVTYAVVLPNNELISLAAGWADRENGVAMTPTHKMLGGSTGKVFYSVVVMQLVSEGKIQLDVPIQQYLAGYDWFKRLPNAQNLTMRSLLRHESGIPRYVFKEQFQADVLKDADKVWEPKELLAYVFDDEPLFSVGEGFAYSDTNYIIAAMVVESVTGRTLYQETMDRVVKKAGLKFVEPQDKRTYNGLAQGYNEDDPFFPGLALDEQGRSRYNWQFEWAGGGLVITSQDLAILAKQIYEGKMFNPDLLPEYFNGRDAAELGGQWGLGVHIRNSPYGKIYGHSGFMPGYITNMFYFVEDGFAICYQINGSAAKYRSIMRDLPRLTAIVKESIQN